VILDHIDNAEFYYDLGPHVKTGLSFLKDTEKLLSLPTGRVDIDGDNVFALVQRYETKAFKQDMWEAHKTYFDIQYILRGTEKIAIVPIEDAESRTIYDAENDYWLFKATGDALKITENQFMLLAPQDVHQPGLIYNNNSQEIRKIVVKVRI